MTDDEFTRLFEDHYSAVLAYGLRRVDPDTARDVAAETFLVAWRQLQVAPQGPRPWLLAVARRVLANELRRQGRHDRLNDRIGEAARVDDRGLVHPDHAEAVVNASPVAAALASLPSRDRELLQLVGWEQLDQRAAAQVLGCSVGALRVRLHRARRRLHAAIADLESEPDASHTSAVLPLPLRRPASKMENLR